MNQLANDHQDAVKSIEMFRVLIKEYKNKVNNRHLFYRILDVINQIEDLLKICSFNSYKASSVVVHIFSKCIDSLKENTDVCDLNRIFRLLLQCRLILNKEFSDNESMLLNSAEFYEKEIRTLNERLNSLSDELKEKENMLAEEVAIKESEKNNLLEQIEQFKWKEEQVKQRDDAKALWKKSIEESFKILDSDIKPIRDEKQRLKCLYGAYCFLAVVMLGILIMTEVIAINKLNNYEGIPPFSIYISLIAPLPIALSLLFVFITQINRAQRQMVSISKYIQDIKYIEGILQAINTLSVDIDDSMKRINEALDKLLERYLKNDKERLHEESLKLLEKKDTIPLGQVYDFLSNIREVSDKLKIKC